MTFLDLELILIPGGLLILASIFKDFRTFAHEMRYLTTMTYILVLLFKIWKSFEVDLVLFFTEYLLVMGIVGIAGMVNNFRFGELVKPLPPEDETVLDE